MKILTFLYTLRQSSRQHTEGDAIVITRPRNNTTEVTVMLLASISSYARLGKIYQKAE